MRKIEFGRKNLISIFAKILAKFRRKSLWLKLFFFLNFLGLIRPNQVTFSAVISIWKKKILIKHKKYKKRNYKEKFEKIHKIKSISNFVLFITFFLLSKSIFQKVFYPIGPKRVVANNIFRHVY